MTREGVDAKARRLLAEGRLVVERVERWPVGAPPESQGTLIVARCRGDSGNVYRLGYDPRNQQWRCGCEARGRCSHLIALQLVAVVAPTG